MSVSSPFTGKSGKCSNFGNCALADAHTIVQIPNGMDFVCTECGKPLLLSQSSTGAAAGAGSGGGQTMRIVLLAMVVLGLLGGGAWFLLRGKKSEAPPPTSPTVTAPVDTPAPAPLTGNCSDADAQAGLCRKK